MTFTPQLPLHMDSTQIVCFRSCPQKFYKEFVLGLRPPGLSIDLHAGGAFAHALDTAYRCFWGLGLPWEEALDRARAAFFMYWGDFEIPEWKRTAKTPDRMWEAVESYFHQYPPQTDEVQPYFAADGKPTFEYTFAIPLEPTCDSTTSRAYSAGEIPEGFPEHPAGGPFIWTGRFDLLGSLRGRPVVRDEKTTGSSIGANWARQWQLRNQFMGYVWACQQCGISVDQVVVRGISILKTDIKHAETVQTFSSFLISQWHEQLRRDMWRLRRAWDERYWDFNFGDACTSYGSCMFLDSCSSNTPEAWLSDFEVRRWNPLEKNPAKVDLIGEARAI